MKESIETFTELKRKHSQDYQNLSKRYNYLGLVRFVLIASLVTLMIIYIKSNNLIFLISSLVTVLIFLLLIKHHGRLSFNKKLKKTLIDINNDEISFLNKESLPFNNGIEYIDQKHPYSFDLDIFGQDSLFQNINRTASYMGKSKLADLLLSHLSINDIKHNQEAVAELSGKLDFRQRINAIAKIADDSKEVYNSLINWLDSNQKKPSKLLHLFSFISPLVIVILLCLHFVEGSDIFRTLAIGLFLFNIGVLTAKLKSIKREIIGGTKIDKIIKNYSLVIKSIESESLGSQKLITLNRKLFDKSEKASDKFASLSSLFSQLDTLFNLIGAFLTNGFALYHIHIYRKLIEWKVTNRKCVEEWLEVVGEFEALGSLANFSFNNPKFTFPELNDKHNIDIQDLGHPLINTENRIDNTVDFLNQRFIILTGSNMSGKSTFLRSLGINMILAGIGSVICASKANIHPLRVWVSMRLSDSLEDNESYFFAEVKRLKEIMDHANSETTFILLDEILRGTNSEDKHVGTVEVVKKLISKGAIGAIATHDLKVCLTTDDYPEILTNKCFEVETINNELVFDYKLREGICENKSATFLMEKMGVI